MLNMLNWMYLLSREEEIMEVTLLALQLKARDKNVIYK
jgi:hypothetical protein